MKRELSFKLVIYKNWTKMHSQQNIGIGEEILWVVSECNLHDIGDLSDVTSKFCTFTTYKYVILR
jgi:hypothetical protein